MPYRTFFALSALALCSACPLDKSDSLSEDDRVAEAEKHIIDAIGKPADDLTLADFTVPNYRSLDRDDIVDEINDEDNFMVDNSDTVITVTASPDEDSLRVCIENKITNPLVTAGHNGNGLLTLNLYNLQECLPAEPNLPMYEMAFSSTMDDMIGKDEFGNTVTIIGKRLKELEDVHISHRSHRFLMKVRGAYILNGTTYPFEIRSKYKVHQQGNISQACSSGSNISGCIFTDISFMTITNIGGFVDYTQLTANSLYRDRGKIFYYSGNMGFQFNDWTGTMQYGSSGDEIPTYTARNTINNTVTGSYGSSTYTFTAKPAFSPQTTADFSNTFTKEIIQAVNTAIHSAQKNAAFR